MRLGLHVSIAGGLVRACDRAETLRAQSLQIFTRSPRSWQARPLDRDDAAGFRRAVSAAGIAPVFVHAPYLVNLATGDSALAARSRTVLVEELERAGAIGAAAVVVHPGRSTDRVRALTRVTRQVNRVLGQAQGRALLLLENTGGARSEVGSRFEELATVINAVRNQDRLGVALDTAHLFAAGYELRTPAGLDATLREFDRSVGLGRLHLVHLNDSRFALGSGRDRHWHIGKGEIGTAGFRAVLNHPLLNHLPGILETPKTNPGDDRRNLTALRRLLN